MTKFLPRIGRSKNHRRLYDEFRRIFGDDFAAHGPAVIAYVRKTNPTAYLKIYADTFPREFKFEVENTLAEISDAQIDEIIEALRERAEQARLVEPQKPEVPVLPPPKEKIN